MQAYALTMVAQQKEAILSLPELRDPSRIYTDVVPFHPDTLPRMQALNAHMYPHLETIGVAPTLIAARVDQRSTSPGTGTIRITTAEPHAPTLGDLARSGDPRVYSADFIGQVARFQGKLHQAGVLYAGFQPDTILAVPTESDQPEFMIRRLAFVHNRKGALDDPAIYAQQLCETIAALQLGDRYHEFIATAYRPRRKHTNLKWQGEDDALFLDDLKQQYTDLMLAQQHQLGLPLDDSPLSSNIVTGIAFPDRLVSLKGLERNHQALLAA